jgi:hypothetical protein
MSSAPTRSATSRPVVQAQARKSDLARIHMLKAELGWDEDMYRDVMATVCQGVRSSAQLDITGRTRLIEHLRRCLERDGAPAAKRALSASARKPLSATGKKLWSLWMQAADAGLVRERTMAALNAWVARQTGVERVEWLKDAQADLAIESMKKWVKRGGAAAAEQDAKGST